MTNLEVFLLIAVLLILIGGGVILYLGLAGLARIKKIMRRRAWVNGHRTGKARKSTWKRA